MALRFPPVTPLNGGVSTVSLAWTQIGPQRTKPAGAKVNCQDLKTYRIEFRQLLSNRSGLSTQPFILARRTWWQRPKLVQAPAGHGGTLGAYTGRTFQAGFPRVLMRLGFIGFRPLHLACRVSAFRVRWLWRLRGSFMEIPTHLNP